MIQLSSSLIWLNKETQSSFKWSLKTVAKYNAHYSDFSLVELMLACSTSKMRFLLSYSTIFFEISPCIVY